MLPWIARRLWPVLRAASQGWSRDDGPLLAAAMAYYAAFSLFPLCLVAISVLGFVMRFSYQAQDQREQMLSLVAQNAGPWLAEQLGHLLDGVQTNAAVGGPLGLLALLATAVGLFAQLDSIFDRIWGTRPQGGRGWRAAVRRALCDRALAFLAMLAVGGILLAVLVADIALSGIKPYVAQLPGGRYAWQLSQLGLSLAADALMLAVLYKVLPNAPVRWREALAGGVPTAVVLQFGQWALISFVIGQKYTAYGVVGTFIGVMLWFYFASAVLFFGAEFVAAICRDCRPASQTTSGPT